MNTTLLTGFWNRFEIYCRELTERWRDVRVISGPLVLPGNKDDKGHARVSYSVQTRNLLKLVQGRFQMMQPGSRLDTFSRQRSVDSTQVVLADLVDCVVRSRSLAKMK